MNELYHEELVREENDDRNTKTTEYMVLSWEIILPYKTWFIPELEGIKCLQPERVLIIPSI